MINFIKIPASLRQQTVNRESDLLWTGHFGCVYRGLLTLAEQKSHSLVAVKTLRHVDGKKSCAKYLLIFFPLLSSLHRSCEHTLSLLDPESEFEGSKLQGGIDQGVLGTEVLQWGPEAETLGWGVGTRGWSPLKTGVWGGAAKNWTVVAYRQCSLQCCI